MLSKFQKKLLMNKLVKDYANAYENLNKDTLEEVLNCVDEELLFIDPFNEIKGKENFKNLFIEMFKKIEGPKFKILNLSNNNEIFFIKWSFSGIYKKKFWIEGISEITVKNNLIIKHVDYWASGKNFYCNLPLIGGLFKKFHS